MSLFVYLNWFVFVFYLKYMILEMGYITILAMSFELILIFIFLCFSRGYCDPFIYYGKTIYDVLQ